MNEIEYNAIELNDMEKKEIVDLEGTQVIYFNLVFLRFHIENSEYDDWICCTFFVPQNF